MASRVNTKFVFLLTAVLVGCVAVLGVVWIVFLRPSPEALIQKGDAYYQEDEYYLALESYQKAIGQRPEDTMLLSKFVELLNSLPAKNTVEATSYLGKKMQALRMITEARPSDEQALQEYYQEMKNLARDWYGRGQYFALFNLASVHLASHPQSKVARRYSGIAHVNLLTDDMTNEKIQQTLDDLAISLEHQPDDAEVIYHIARWNLFEANRQDRPGGHPAEAVRLRTEALRLSQEMLAGDPDDTQRMLYNLQVLLHGDLIGTNEEGLSEDQQREQFKVQAALIATKLESKFLANPAPQHETMYLYGVLQWVDQDIVAQDGDMPQTTRGIQRSGALVTAALALDPDNVAYLNTLARVSLRHARQDEALKFFRKSQAVSSADTPVRVLRSQSMKLTAAYEIGKILLVQAAKDENAEQRKALLAEVKSIIDQITKTAGESNYLPLLQGRLALTEGKYLDADVYLDIASQNMGDSNLEVLELSADTRNRRGEWGAAAERLLQAIALLHGREDRVFRIHNLRRKLASIYLSHDDVDSASKQITLMLEGKPGDRGATMLQASLLTQQGHFDEAIAVYEGFDLEKIPQLRAPLAVLYLKAGDEDRARELLIALNAENPANGSVLRTLLPLVESDEQKEKLLSAAHDAGVDEFVLEQLRTGMTASLEDRLKMLSDSTADPLRIALAKANLHRASGDMEAMKKALAEAAAIDPDHQGAVGGFFDLALAEKDWPRAAALADRAGKLNLDGANGEFYRAHLASQQGDWGLAAAGYRRGLERNRNYSQGWLLLGKVLSADRKWSEAADAFAQALVNKPNNVEALFSLAFVHLQLQNTSDALDNMRTAFQFQPENPRLMNEYVRFEYQYGDKDRALAVRQDIAEEEPENMDNQRALAPMLADNEQLEEALATVNIIVEKEGLTRDNVHLLSTVYHLGGEDEAGLKVIEEHLRKRGALVDAMDYVLLARYLRMTNDGEGAMQAYFKAIATEDPQERPASRELSAIMFRRGMFKQSLSMFQSMHEQWPNDKQIALRLVQVYVSLGQIDKAVPVLEQLKQDSDQQNIGTQLLVIESMIARHEGDLEKALQYMSQAVRQSPEVASLYFQRAEILIALDRIGPAKDDLDQTLSLQRNHLQSRMLLAALHFDRQEYDDAIRELQTLLTISSKHLPARERLLGLYVQQNELGEADRLLRETLELFPDNDRVLQQAASLAQQRGNNAEALSLRQQAVSLSPTAANVLALTRVMMAMNNLEDVVALLDGHRQFVEQAPVLLAVRCHAIARLGQTDEARTGFAQSMERCGSFAQFSQVVAHLNAAFSPDEVLQSLEAAAESGQTLWSGFTIARLQLQAGDPVESLKTLLIIEGHITDDMRNIFDRIRAMALYASHDYAAAREAFQALLVDRPNDATMLNNLAYLLVEDMDNPAEALPLAEQAVALEPKAASILDTLGWIQYRSGRFDDALASFNRSIANQPLAMTYLHRGIVYEELGSVTRAREDYTSALELAEKADNEQVMEQATTSLEALSLAVKE